MRRLQRKVILEGQAAAAEPPGESEPSMFYLETLGDGKGHGTGAAAAATRGGAAHEAAADDGGAGRQSRQLGGVIGGHHARAPPAPPAAAVPQMGRVLLGGSHMVTPGGATLPWPQAWE